MRGRECLVQAVRRPQWGLLCKLQRPFTAGVQQKCFLYVPEMFMHLFSLARDGLLQLSAGGGSQFPCSNACLSTREGKVCLFNETHLTS